MKLSTDVNLVAWMQEAYTSLTEKTLVFLRTVSRHFDARYIVKVDDDVFLRVDRLPFAFKQWDEVHAGKSCPRGSVLWLDKAYSKGVSAIMPCRCHENLATRLAIASRMQVFKFQCWLSRTGVCKVAHLDTGCQACLHAAPELRCIVTHYNRPTC